ncbi:hypothetical protein FDE98_02525 [Clostridium sporogenes]|uniref:Uncharacterized protein n=1 Tax=Clostridium sporogenes TaxID=1509 RepID=A0A7X5P6X0_CLOSG|nr:hypothetical protein [Clostridium sporogenes]NFQ17046.1 hypothetical protein [Clostridium sporogenes]NFQ21060.1 hypothetical protein [Clostridium sporogenes]NFQ27585.1 hypothetical protein [Clostridium sporogenes]NFR36571.1 hypothetical protein [Clostridium sporogenes]
MQNKSLYKANKREYCKNFKKGSNGFCEHYMGCKVDLISCSNQCEVGGICEDRKDIKNSAT